MIGYQIYFTYAYAYVVVLLSLFAVGFCQFVYSEIGNFTINYPAFIHTVGTVEVGKQIKAIFTWDDQDQMMSLKFAKNGVFYDEVIDVSPVVFTHTVSQQANYTFKVQKFGNKPIPYELNVYIDDSVLNSTNNLAVVYNYLKPVYMAQFLFFCPRTVFSSSQRSVFSNFYVFSPSQIPTIIDIDQGYLYGFNSQAIQMRINVNQSGIWYLIAQDASSIDPNSSYLVQKSANIFIRCLLCGDGIRQQGQQCDNGNNTGCIDCQVGTGYVCTGQVNYTSTCSCQTPQYNWDAIMQACRIDCTRIPFTTGNAPNTIGQCLCIDPLIFATYRQVCIVDCSLIPYAVDIFGVTDSCTCNEGYTWKPFRCNFVCGDGIKVIEQQCDDGNIQNGDGCDSECSLQGKKPNLEIIIGFSVGGAVFFALLILVAVKLVKCIKRRKIFKKKNKVQNIHNQSQTTMRIKPKKQQRKP